MKKWKQEKSKIPVFLVKSQLFSWRSSYLNAVLHKPTAWRTLWIWNTLLSDTQGPVKVFLPFHAQLVVELTVFSKEKKKHTWESE